jgi:hypothetical protein
VQARKALYDYQFEHGGRPSDPIMQLHRKSVQDLCHGF